MKGYPVTVLCKVMRVSRTGYYQYLKRINRGPESDPAETVLETRIQAILKAHRSKYGVRRIIKELNNQGYQIGIYKVRRLMKELGLKVKSPRRYKVITDSRYSFSVAPNVLNRQFDVDQPNRFWTADITYVCTLEGWMYRAVVMDLFSRRIVDWAMDKRMKAQLSIDALAMAYWMRKPAKGLVHHSDRGSQYACHEYRHYLDAYGMIPSMSRKGDCWYNSPTERFFRSLKAERLSDYVFTTRKAA
jgi:transposase InsO family protein